MGKSWRMPRRSERRETPASPAKKSPAGAGPVLSAIGLSHREITAFCARTPVSSKPDAHILAPPADELRNSIRGALLCPLDSPPRPGATTPACTACTSPATISPPCAPSPRPIGASARPDEWRSPCQLAYSPTAMTVVVLRGMPSRRSYDLPGPWRLFALPQRGHRLTRPGRVVWCTGTFWR